MASLRACMLPTERKPVVLIVKAVVTSTVISSSISKLRKRVTAPR
jgi:hypothetical protein